MFLLFRTALLVVAKIHGDHGFHVSFVPAADPKLSTVVDKRDQRTPTMALLACHPEPSGYTQEVLEWLNSQQVPWRRLTLEHSYGLVVALGSSRGGTGDGDDLCALALHLLPWPRCAGAVMPATANARLTEECAQLGSPRVLVHLHEDVWRTRGDIARARLLARLGRVRSRVFARKTRVCRIGAATYMPFLEEHHLWGATRAKYGYGLYNGDELVAVATFSARRRVVRAGVPHRSHELLRTCAQRDGAVVGGITKLVKAFCRAHAADDVVTVVDRDWGTAAGWHAMGFATVQVMPPLPMAIGPDGVRRHLVGAGLVPAEAVPLQMPADGLQTPFTSLPTRSATAAAAPPGHCPPSLLRVALPDHVQQQLAAFDADRHDPDAPRAWLMQHGFYPVHDAGVERLLLLVHDDTPGAAVTAWQRSTPSYASQHYSSNPGIAALLAAAAREGSGAR